MKRHGIATALVIGLIGVLAVVLAAVSTHLMASQRRAAITADEAQASRLLVAAKEIARAQLSAGKPVDGPVDSPVGSIALAWHGDGATRTCAVTIETGRVRRDASLTFASTRVTAEEP